MDEVHRPHRKSAAQKIATPGRRKYEKYGPISTWIAKGSCNISVFLHNAAEMDQVRRANRQRAWMLSPNQVLEDRRASGVQIAFDA